MAKEGAPPCMAQDGCYVDGRGEIHTCEPSALLNIIIPGLRRDGVVSVLTGSKTDIANISGTLVYMKQRSDRYGIPLTEIPMQVTRHVQQVSCPMPDGSRRRMPKSLLRLEVLPAWINQTHACPQTTQGRMLPMTPDQELDNALGPAGETLEQTIEAEMMPPAKYAPKALPEAQDQAASQGEEVPFVEYGADDQMPHEQPPAQAMPPQEEQPVHPHLNKHDAAALINLIAEMGFIGEHKSKWRMLFSIIVNRAVSDFDSIKGEDFSKLINGLQTMQRMLPTTNHNIEFVDDMKTRFQSGFYDLSKFDFQQELPHWYNENVPAGRT